MISNKYNPAKLSEKSNANRDAAMDIIPGLLGTIAGTALGVPQLGSVVGAVTQQFKYGGRPVEIEKQEVATRTDGSKVKFNAPSHSNGGQNYVASFLDDYIFSDAIGYDAKNNITNKPKRSFADVVKGLGNDPISNNTKKAIKMDNDKARMKYGGNPNGKYQLGGDPLLELPFGTTDPSTAFINKTGLTSVNMPSIPSTTDSRGVPLANGMFPDNPALVAQLDSILHRSPTSTYTGNSITDYLSSIGQPNSMADRKVLADQNGISNYTGTAAQNTQLLNTLRSTQVAPVPNIVTPVSPISPQTMQALSSVTVPTAPMPVTSNNPQNAGLPSTTNDSGIDMYSAGLLANLAGVGINLGRGFLGRPEVQDFVPNSNANEVDNLMGSMSTNNQALQDRSALSRRTAITNARNNASSEQVAQSLAQNIDAANNRNTQELQIQQQAMLNQILGQRAGVMNQRGEYDRQTTLAVDDINARNRGAQEAIGNMGISQVSDLATQLMAFDVQQRQDAVVQAILAGMLPNFTLNGDISEEARRGAVEMIDHLIRFIR